MTNSVSADFVAIGFSTRLIVVCTLDKLLRRIDFWLVKVVRSSGRRRLARGFNIRADRNRMFLFCANTIFSTASFACGSGLQRDFFEQFLIVLIVWQRFLHPIKYLQST
jgi:hypothetical protein